MDRLFYSQKEYYQDKLGGRFQKIPLTIASTCPNREGLRGMQTCVFCDEWGSSAYPEQRHQSLQSQIESKIGLIGKARSVTNFLAYFQTYTSTFLSVQRLKSSFDAALAHPQVRGLIIGTRPDCLSPAVIEIINEYAKKTYFAVELGVQTLFDHHLDFLRRGHNARKSLDAIMLIKSRTKVDLGVHLMFGLPQETDEELVETAKILSDHKVTSVKLHNLHVLKGTPLEQLYYDKQFEPISLEEYTRRVALFLEHLDSEICIERLAALSSRWNELVAPLWTRHKLKTRDYMVMQFKTLGLIQGVKAAVSVPA